MHCIQSPFFILLIMIVIMNLTIQILLSIIIFTLYSKITKNNDDKCDNIYIFLILLNIIYFIKIKINTFVLIYICFSKTTAWYSNLK